MRFRLVDRIEELEPGQRIRAVKSLPASEELFRDHFPGFPVVPGVLLTEMMAQAAGKCIDASGSHPGRAMLAEIRTARFRDWVRPDEEIVIQAEITRDRRGYAMARCRLEVGGKKVGSADLMFAFLPYDRFAAEYRDEVLEAYLAGEADAR